MNHGLGGMQITMLNGLGCGECGGTCGQQTMGAAPVTEADIRKFFIGKDLYVKHQKPIGVYSAPGSAIIKTVPATDTIGRVVDLNSKNNWAKLADGTWISIAPGVIDGYYTVILTTPPPKSVTEAVSREAEKVIDAIPLLPSLATMKWLLIGGVILVGAVVVYKVFPDESKAAASSLKKKITKKK